MSLPMQQRLVQVFRVWAYSGQDASYRSTDLIGSLTRDEAERLGAKANSLWDWINQPENEAVLRHATSIYDEFNRNQPAPPRDAGSIAHDRYKLNRHAVLSASLKQITNLDDESVVVLTQLFNELGTNVTVLPRMVGVSMMPMLRPQPKPAAVPPPPPPSEPVNLGEAPGEPRQ